MTVVSRRAALGLALLVASLLPFESAWAGVQKWGDTGKVSAVTVESRTIVVEIPRGTDSLTVGAEVLPEAILEADGQTIDLEDIQVGDQVRIEWSRTEQGILAHKIIVTK
jgi:hypothetical protein